MVGFLRVSGFQLKLELEDKFIHRKTQPLRIYLSYGFIWEVSEPQTYWYFTNDWVSG